MTATAQGIVLRAHSGRYAVLDAHGTLECRARRRLRRPDETWPEFPVPVGVLRDVSQPTHSDLMEGQIQQAIEKSGEGDIAKALLAGETWVVE